MLLKSVFIGFLSFFILHADTLKECKTEADKISGCVEREYHSNGNLRFEIPYKNAKEVGVETWYYENGNIEEEILHKSNKTKWYDQNGNLQAELSFKNDKLHGDLKFYTENKELLVAIKAQNHKLMNGTCSNGKTLTHKELEDMFNFVGVNEVMTFLRKICLANP
ncbi:MAG: toxin-antitoxin system YwqK family antitoxin [Helicobacter sp.]|uniref:toxin-antitoxin system YwqK family antitoxin n=1 Tax=Helicobacter sp. TaxID=218 RepID=UPI002A90BE6A|nr:toxin-antitoxin system YwqK family antitoxin [Helicobacter sp.]MDY5822040.1 toxin-antitoxin system YwqK family antitoxin [Helicobacter sp.]